MTEQRPNPPKNEFMPSPRAGAAAALQVPSLHNGQRVAYKPPVAQCVGLTRGSGAFAP